MSKIKTTSSKTQSDYIAWLSLIPEVERNAVADLVSSVELKSAKDLVTLSQKMLSAVLRGTISPDISEEARKWAELMLASLTVDLAGTKGTNMSMSVMMLMNQTTQEISRTNDLMKVGMDVFANNPNNIIEKADSDIVVENKEGS